MHVARKYLKHFPKWERKQYDEEPEEFEEDYGEATFRMTGGTVKVTRPHLDDVYYYRGREIHQDLDTPVGYYGRWHTGRDWTSTLAHAKEAVDARIRKS